MGFDLKGKVALVTGGSAGIGRATVQAFAAAGAGVMISDVDDARGEVLAAELRAAGHHAAYRHADVSDAGQVRALLAATVETFGGLDFAINNAGIEGKPAPTTECSDANWERTLAVNLTGAWYCMREEIPALRARGGGVIVNVSSIAGLKGFPNLPAYVASKHGLVGLTKSAALELAREGIRVNAVCPAAIDTEMIHRFAGDDPQVLAGLHAMQPVGRMGTSEEVADAILYLCTDGARFLTGVILPVDGGVMAG